MTRNTRYTFESYEQKLVVFMFMAVFISYFPQFWGSREIYTTRNTRYMFESYDQKFGVFTFYGPGVWDSMEICMANKTDTF